MTKGLLIFLLVWWLLVMPAGSMAAECSASVQLDDVGTLQFDNRSKGCSVWSVAIFSRGFATFQFTLETAPDAGGTPGAWSAVSTILTGPRGTLPATDADGANQAYSFAAYAPWVRVNLEAVTGAGVWRARLAGELESARGQLPLVGPIGCDTRAVSNIAGRVITGVAGKSIYICHFGMTNSVVPGSLQVNYGTGVNCGTGTTILLPIMQFAAAGVPTFTGSSRPILRVPAGNDVCVAAGGGNVAGWFFYTIW